MDMSEVRACLWADNFGPSLNGDSRTGTLDTILEQYKIYVEMADRISARRGLSNTLNTAIFALLGSLAERLLVIPSWVLLFPFFSMLCQCGGWFYLLRSYRQLNSAKFVVIGALEERLPASPYWRAEWAALGKGKRAITILAAFSYRTVAAHFVRYRLWCDVRGTGNAFVSTLVLPEI